MTSLLVHYVQVPISIIFAPNSSLKPISTRKSLSDRDIPDAVYVTLKYFCECYATQCRDHFGVRRAALRAIPERIGPSILSYTYTYRGLIVCRSIQ